MPVYKDKERNTWYISYQKKDPVTGKVTSSKKRGFATKREAVAAEKELLFAEARSDVTFADIVKVWEDATQASAITRQKHEEHFTIRFPFYDYKLESISKAILSQWRANLAQDDRFSTTTKNRTISYVKSVFRFAHQTYDLPNTADFLTRLQKTDEEVLAEIDKELNVWTVEEFNQFIAKVNHPVYSVFFCFLFWTGCRRGEAIALQKKDLNGNSVTIKYSQRTQTQGLKPTKKRTVRTIKIDDILVSQLQPLLKQPGNYVFGGEAGLSVNMIDTWFHRGIQESGVKRIRLHDLRHSHASWLINNGVNIVAVSKRLGHKDITTTLNTYTHLLESTDNGMMAKINRAKSCQTHATA